MNTVVVSREKLLEISIRLVRERGPNALNIRDVASGAGVAVGSVYNYFPNKQALLEAAIEGIWRDIFHKAGKCSTFNSFEECVQTLFEGLRAGVKQYPSFLQEHSAVFTGKKQRADARDKMQQVFVHIQQELLEVLQRDLLVKQDVWSDNFTQQELVEFVFCNIMMLLQMKAEHCTVLLQMLRSTIYEQ